jgi:hypothetical protein
MDPSFDKFKNNLRRIRDEGLDPVASYILGCYAAHRNEDQFYNLMINSFRQAHQLQCTEIERIRLLFNISEANFGSFTQEYNSIIYRLSNSPSIQSQYPVISQPAIIPIQINQPRFSPEEVKMQEPARPQPQIINPNSINISNLNPTNGQGINIAPIPFTACDKPPVLDPHRDRPSVASGHPVNPGPPVPQGSYSVFQSYANPSNQRPPIRIPPIPQDRNCLVCDSVVNRDLEFFLPCNHIFHRNCAVVIVESCIENRQYPARCSECSSQIPDEYILQLIQPEKFNMYLHSKKILPNEIRNVCTGCRVEYTGQHSCSVVCNHINKGYKSDFGQTALCNCGQAVCRGCNNELVKCRCHRN